MSGFQPGQRLIITRDVYDGSELAFASGETVSLLRDTPLPEQPQYRYEVYSERLSKSLLLTVNDLTVISNRVSEIPAAKEGGRWNRKTVLILAGISSVLLAILIVTLVFVFIPSENGNSKPSENGNALSTFKSEYSSLSFDYPADLKESPAFGGVMTIEGVSTVTEASLANVSKSKEVEEGHMSLELKAQQSLFVTCIPDATDEFVTRETSMLSDKDLPYDESNGFGMTYEKKMINGTEALIECMISDRYDGQWVDYTLGMKVSEAYYIIKFSGKTGPETEQAWNEVISTIRF